MLAPGYDGSAYAKKCHSFIYFTSSCACISYHLENVLFTFKKKKKNVSSESLYNLGTSEAKVKSSLELPLVGKLRSSGPVTVRWSAPLLPAPGMTLRRTVCKAYRPTSCVPVYLKRMQDVDPGMKSFEFPELLKGKGVGWGAKQTRF